MRKAKTILGILGMAMLGFCAISVMAAQGDFSGTWALDKQKTHGLPKDLKSYTMVVTQNEQQIVIDTKLEGEAQAKANDSHVGGGGYLGSVGGGGGGFAAGTLALSIVNPRVTYSLDGKETTAGGSSNVTNKFKAKRSKDGKTLDLSIVMTDTTPMRTGATESIKERWTLSADGAALKVQRSVSTASGVKRSAEP
jgi:hypothetical protein